MTLDPDELKNLKKEIRDEVKKEVLAEIYKELQIEESESNAGASMPLDEVIAQETPVRAEPAKSKEKIVVSVRSPEVRESRDEIRKRFDSAGTVGRGDWTLAGQTGQEWDYTVH